MVKNIFKISVFFVLFIAAYYSIYYCLFNTKYKGEFSIKYLQKKTPVKPDILMWAIRDVKKEKDLDILFLGSSHCYRAFDPKYFEEANYKVFNLGSSSQTPINSYFLLEQYIHKTKNVILEIYPVTYSISGNEALTDMVGACNDYDMLIRQAISLKEFYPLQMLSLKPFIDKVIASKKMDKCIYRKGYVQVLDSAKNRKVIYEPVTLSTKGIEFQLKYLKKIIALCKENNKKLILAYAPIPSKFIFTNEVYFKTKIYKIITENNIAFIDMSHKHGLIDEYNFYDDDHLNASGVMLFNKELIARLKSVIKN